MSQELVAQDVNNWKTIPELMTEFNLQRHQFLFMVDKGIFEGKILDGEKRAKYRLVNYYPYDDSHLSTDEELKRKIVYDYQNGYFTNISSSLNFYLSKNKKIAELCQRILDEEPAYWTIQRVLLAIADESKGLKYCIICGKAINMKNYKDEKSREKAVFCSRDCAMTDAGKKYQVERFKEKNPINPMQREEVKEKLRKTNLERYGYENVGANPEVKKKREQTTLERYGVTNYFEIVNKEENLEVKSKRSYTIFSKFLKSINLEPLFDYEYYKFRSRKENKKKDYLFKCLKCDTVFSRRDFCRYRKGIYCPNCAKESCRSIREKDFITWLMSITDENIVSNRRTLISPYEIDAYVENSKIAFEFNGIYWHSEKAGKENDYHLMKTEMCESKGYRLIHIFEDEWNFKNRIVKSRIKHILNLCKNSIYARNCEIKMVDKELEKKFFNKYHIQGYIHSSVALGLFYKNRLVALMSFGKPRFNKNYDWELLRYCTIFNFNIIGGASKIYSHFKKNYTGSLITYADRRWSDGGLYRKLGMNELEPSKPSYFYVRNNERYSRFQFQKHKLKDVLENFDENLTEEQNALNNGFYRIWDCGCRVFEDKLLTKTKI